MTVDRRTPVIVGVGQVTQRLDDSESERPGREPVDLLADAVRAADADARARRSLVAAADIVAVCGILSWRYPDPARLVADRVGAAPRETVLTTVGGNSPQMLVTRLSAAVARGEVDVAVIGGAECMYTRHRLRRTDSGARPAWTRDDGPACPNVWGDDRPGTSPYEMAHMALAPVQVYPLFETAVRHAAGRSVDEHQHHVSELWSQFAAAAADNPYAWTRTAPDAAAIRTPAAANRLVTFPYTKLMCANLDVDQAAALVLCSYGAARDAGVPQERLVFPLAGADGHDHYYFTERHDLAESPAIRLVARAALDAAARHMDDIARFDLYSCFPSAVQMAMAALGLRGPTGGDSRPLTVTGGLAFAGGPGNNYPSHSIAAMVDACRRDPGSVGLVTGLGWYVTKHSVGLYSSHPPDKGFVAVDHTAVQRAIDTLPRREPAGQYTGAAQVEATAVVMERDGAPNFAIVSLLTPDGHRALALARDRDVLDDMIRQPWEDRAVDVRADGDTNSIADSHQSGSKVEK